MRRNPTEPEKLLWRRLSASQLDGYKFRGQAIIEPYICDFLCPQKMLIVEVDGDTHDEFKDAPRDSFLKTAGYTAVHVTNDNVMRNMDGISELILSELQQLSDRWSSGTPHPNPSPEGEGL